LFTHIDNKLTFSFVFLFYMLYMSGFAVRNYKEYWNRVVQNIMLDKQGKEKEQLQKQMFHATKLASIGELAAGVAHEINNPLMIIQGNIEMIKADAGESDLLRYVHMQQDAVNRIATIVQGLKTYARFDLDVKEDVSVHEAIRSSVLLVESIYATKNIRIEQNLKARNSFIHGNLNKLQQIFMNLLSNSRDALLGISDPLITIDTMNEEGRILVNFWDNGAGIDDEISDKIFDSFFTTKETGTGTGLGLSISYSLIMGMNGDIKVRSEKGVGTLFTISFPVIT
ncbi:MAG: hypothetical protein JXA66_05285, partial [Oligoflexia bacterium]|nr:hypothetical protein [Oligoflexia bacterium]